jgi:hypothetical protein
MAIEDEIINITDIDVGTEILNNDKLIIETNNGTKLLAFKDLVIGEDNITFKDKLVQGADATGQSSTKFSTVTGYKILTSETTAGHVIKYADISGTVELGKFNYSGVSNLAALSATIIENEAKISDLQANLTTIYDKLQNTSSDDLNAITITTKPVNFKLSTANNANNGTKTVGFDTIDLDPSVTNDQCAFEENPFKITYPSDSSYSASWMLYIAEIIVSHRYYGSKVILYVNSSAVASALFLRDGRGSTATAKLQTFQYISQGAEVTLQFTGAKNTATQKGSTFAGVKIS